MTKRKSTPNAYERAASQNLMMVARLVAEARAGSSERSDAELWLFAILALVGRA